MTRIATIPLQQAQAAGIARATGKLNDVINKLSSGKKSPDLAGLGSDAVRSLSTRNMLARQEAQGREDQEARQEQADDEQQRAAEHEPGHALFVTLVRSRRAVVDSVGNPSTPSRTAVSAVAVYSHSAGASSETIRAARARASSTAATSSSCPMRYWLDCPGAPTKPVPGVSARWRATWGGARG